MPRKYYRTSKNAEGCAFLLVSLYLSIFGRRPTKKQVQALQTFLPTNAERPVELHPVDLERLALYVYQRLGYRNVKHTGASTDGGVDVWMLNSQNNVEIVQCKQWQNRVGKSELIEFAKAIRQHHAEVGHYWAPGGFSQPAVTYAEQNDIKIYSDYSIRKLLEQAIEVDTTRAVQKPQSITAPRKKKILSTPQTIILISMSLLACSTLCIAFNVISSGG